jgi:hypothetical protein
LGALGLFRDPCAHTPPPTQPAFRNHRRLALARTLAPARRAELVEWWQAKVDLMTGQEVQDFYHFSLGAQAAGASVRADHNLNAWVDGALDVLEMTDDLWESSVDDLLVRFRDLNPKLARWVK